MKELTKVKIRIEWGFWKQLFKKKWNFKMKKWEMGIKIKETYSLKNMNRLKKKKYLVENIIIISKLYLFIFLLNWRKKITIWFPFFS